MTTHFLRGYCERAKSTGPLRFVATNEGMQGDGLDLRMSGARIDRFKANPVVGYGHSYYGRVNLPIGKAVETWIDGSKLMADVEFDQADEFATTVERKYRDGYLNAVSIGFSVDAMEPKTGVVTDWELFEISAVPIPMDPAAVVAGGRGILTAEEFRSLLLGPTKGREWSGFVADPVTRLVDGLPVVEWPADAPDVALISRALFMDMAAQISAARSGETSDEDDEDTITSEAAARFLAALPKENQ